MRDVSERNRAQGLGSKSGVEYKELESKSGIEYKELEWKSGIRYDAEGSLVVRYCMSSSRLALS